MLVMEVSDMDAKARGSGQGEQGRTPMDKGDATRIRSAADRNPDSDSATSGFAQRAQSAADRAEHESG